MEQQNFSNHRRFVPGFHIVLSLLMLAGFIGAVINIFQHLNDNGLCSTMLITLLFVCGFMMFWYIRQFPIKAQDRAIRAEESLRYFILTGKAINSSLSPAQIAALRFAGDEEFVELTAKAVSENLSPNDIKKAVKQWRADHHRV